ncbi:hypothetical protein R6Z07F_009799 [Ovis aries]
MQLESLATQSIQFKNNLSEYDPASLQCGSEESLASHSPSETQGSRGSLRQMLQSILAGPVPEMQDGSEEQSRVGDGVRPTGPSWRAAATRSFSASSRPSDGSVLGFF